MPNRVFAPEPRDLGRQDAAGEGAGAPAVPNRVFEPERARPRPRQNASAMAIVLALISAVVYGTSDYCGGRATRSAPLLAVVLVTQVTSASLSVIVIAVWAIAFPAASDVAWSVGGGLMSITAVASFYFALAHGRDDGRRADHCRGQCGRPGRRRDRDRRAAGARGTDRRRGCARRRGVDQRRHETSWSG